MKFNKNTLIIGLMITIAAVFFYQDYQINKYKDKLDSAIPDTVEIYLEPQDTSFTEEADSSVPITSVVGCTVYVDKILYNTVKQPLFTLKTVVNSKDETFEYDFQYNPLKIRLIFNDKYDLREGFEVVTIPNIGKVYVNWGDYVPLKEKKFKFSAGIGYSKGTGPILLGGLSWKKNEIGIFAKTDTYGFYFKRIFVRLF